MKVERKPSSRDGSFADIPPLLKLLGLLVFVLSGKSKSLFDY